MANELTSVLTHSLNNACAAAAQLVDAQDAKLYVMPKCETWRALETCNARIAIADCLPPLAGKAMALPDFSVISTPPQDSFATDLVDLHLDLLFDADATVARLTLSSVPGGWKARSRQGSLNATALVIAGQLKALRQTPKLIATQTLNLLEQLAELDSSVNVPTLVGFLRIMCQRAPTRSQLIALQIAGLVDSASGMSQLPQFALTETAQDVLGRSGLGGWSAVQPEIPAQVPEADIAPAAASTDIRAFAQLRIMERGYIIAEDTPSERMAFRAEGESDWRWLSHTSADGWTTVAAEIIHLDIDVVGEFIRMHMIRRRDLPTEEIAEAFELMGHLLWLRRSMDGLEMRLQDSAWEGLDICPDLPLRDRAVAAFLTLQAQERITPDSAARDWAMRMAHAVQVTPHIAIAAE